MRASPRWSLLIFLIWGASSTVFADRTIIILRHAEKPALGLGQLSCTGLNRSLALAPLLLHRYGTPTAIYAPNPAIKKSDKGVDFAYVRPLATIEPFAIATGSPVILDYGMTDIKPLTKAILAKTEGAQYIAWEHHWAEALTRQLLSQLGADPNAVPKWEDSDFDSLYVIRTTMKKDGQEQAVFMHETQSLTNLSNNCPQSAAPAQ